MKTILLIHLFFPLLLKAQTSTTDTLKQRMYEAGMQLRFYSGQQNVAHALEVTGGGIIGWGAALSSHGNSNSNYYIFSGAGIALVGFILELTSTTHLTKAGIILQSTGIAMPLGNRKKVEKSLQN